MSRSLRFLRTLALWLVASHPFASHAYLTLPESGALTFEYLAGYGDTSTQEFGFGTPSTSSSIEQRDVIFIGQLVSGTLESVSPSPIVEAGYFYAGTELNFYQLSDYFGVHWAFSSQLSTSPTFADLEVFTDRNTGNSAVVQLDATTWMFYLDDAASVDDDDNELIIRMTLDTSAVPPAPDPQPVTIDIKPGADPNCMNINGHGVIPVAILGNAEFDVQTIDQTTLSFAGLEIWQKKKGDLQCHLEDTNIDGYWDLICQFEDDTTKWMPDSETEATLTGNLLDGTAFEGTDSICLRPGKDEEELEATQSEPSNKGKKPTEEDNLDPRPWW